MLPWGFETFDEVVRIQTALPLQGQRAVCRVILGSTGAAAAERFVRILSGAMSQLVDWGYPRDSPANLNWNQVGARPVDSVDCSMARWRWATPLSRVRSPTFDYVP